MGLIAGQHSFRRRDKAKCLMRLDVRVTRKHVIEESGMLYLYKEKILGKEIAVIVKYLRGCQEEVGFFFYAHNVSWILETVVSYMAELVQLLV